MWTKCLVLGHMCRVGFKPSDYKSRARTTTPQCSHDTWLDIEHRWRHINMSEEVWRLNSLVELNDHTMQIVIQMHPYLCIQKNNYSCGNIRKITRMFVMILIIISENEMIYNEWSVIWKASVCLTYLYKIWLKIKMPIYFTLQNVNIFWIFSSNCDLLLHSATSDPDIFRLPP